MNILILSIPISITLAIFFILAYLSAVRTDQFDDLETPAHIPFTDDLKKNNQTEDPGELRNV